jgi:hypothetical protein
LVEAYLVPIYPSNNVSPETTEMAVMDPRKLEPLLQGPREATGLYVEFFGTTLRHGTYLKLKTDRISNDLDDVEDDDIIIGRILSTTVSGGNKGNPRHPDEAKVNIFRVAKASDSRSPPPTLDNEIDTLPQLVQSAICIQIGEEDIEDLAFILTIKDVGNSVVWLLCLPEPAPKSPSSFSEAPN